MFGKFGVNRRKKFGVFGGSFQILSIDAPAWFVENSGGRKGWVSSCVWKLGSGKKNTQLQGLAAICNGPDL